MWSSVAPVSVKEPAPSARSKHSATLVGDTVYLLGGRNGNLPTKDFWKYDIISGEWQLLKPTGEKLPSLQEHTAVAYKDCIYVFGGEVGFSAGTETPLWCYDIKTNKWRKLRTKKGVLTPKGRRGHSALVHRGNMLLFGGYQDLRGSSSELWAFHFETESWHLLSTSPKSNYSECFPAARHKHSAIMHDDCMWIYGGMTDLQERSDFWKWDCTSKKWTIIKTKINPGVLHGHAVCKLPSSMLVFGGERNGHPTNDLWKFNFATETWEKIIISGLKPQPRSESVVFSISELSLQNSVELTCKKKANNRVLLAHNNKVAPSQEKTYIFNPSNENYTDGSDPADEGNTNTKMGLLQEFSKIEKRLRDSKCSYSVLTTTDSTESLLRQHQGTSFEESSDTSATPSRMVKSKSAYSYAIKKRQDGSTLESKKKSEVKRRITWEPISVPNFAALTTLTPVEAAKLVYLDVDEENEFLGGGPKRGESYMSHLAYADNPLYQQMKGRENISSTSDYASIETMNRLSSYSNYSVKTSNPSNDGDAELMQNRKNNESKKGGPFGFCNPHYMGPDIKTLLTNGERKEIANILQHHSDSSDEEEDFLELKHYGRIDSNTKVFYRSSMRRQDAITEENKIKRRTQSAGRAERRVVMNETTNPVNHFIPLYVYVFGGKEQGQITVFQRPISIWKLKLC